MSKALDAIVILDMTGAFWSSLGLALLADFGAHVIKLERPGADGRVQSASTDSEHHHALAERNKSSLVLDWEAPRGREVLDRLVAKADVVATDLPATEVQAHRLDYESLVQLKPDLIYARGSGMGPKGPDRDLPSLDELAAARTGMMPILPQPGQPPVYTGTGQMYSTVMLAFGIMAALRHRDATGEGQEVDVSLLAGNMYGASLDLQAFLAIGGERFLKPVSRLDAGNPMSGTLYQSADGRWVTLTMPDTDRYWPSFAEMVGLDPADSRFDSHERRCEENRLELMQVLEERFRLRDADHWRSEIDRRGLSADVIEEYSYPANDVLARRNGYVLEADGAGGRPRKTLGLPIFMRETPAEVRSAAPSRGQYSTETLSGLLGYAQDEIARLRDEGVVA